MRSFKTVLAVMTLSAGYVAAQIANVQTTLITQAQGAGVIVITEVISVVGTQGATEIVQVNQAQGGVTVTETILISPTEIKHIEDVNNANVQGEEVEDCKIPSNGLATCVDIISAVENGQLVESTVTFMSQFSPLPAPAPSPSKAPASVSPSPTPAPKSNPTSSQNAPNSPTPGAASPSVVIVTATSSSFLASSSSSSSVGSPTNLIVNATSPISSPAVGGVNSTLPAVNSSVTATGVLSFPSSLSSNIATITSQLNPAFTNLSPSNVTNNNGAMINARSIGATIAFTFFGMILRMM